jgi:Flp pilus assembly protein TadB
METRDKDQVIHYYNREKRLERASANAMFAIDRHQFKRPGIIKSLTATRSLSFLFFSLMFMIVAVLPGELHPGFQEQRYH